MDRYQLPGFLISQACLHIDQALPLVSRGPLLFRLDRVAGDRAICEAHSIQSTQCLGDVWGEVIFGRLLSI